MEHLGCHTSWRGDPFETEGTGPYDGDFAARSGTSQSLNRVAHRMTDTPRPDPYALPPDAVQEPPRTFVQAMRQIGPGPDPGRVDRRARAS